MGYLELTADALKGIAAVNRYVEYQMQEMDDLELHDQMPEAREQFLGVLNAVNGWLREYISADLSEVAAPSHPEVALT